MAGVDDATANNPASDETDIPLTLKDRWALIERVATSEQFGRSTRLRDFLLYVGKQSLKKGYPEIHEQEVGIRVFGRPDDYNRTSDNIVRVNATALRKRIESYFESAGDKEPYIFEIPRGGYRLIFLRRPEKLAMLSQPLQTLPSPEPVPAVVAAPPVETTPPRRKFWPFMWPIVGVCFGIVCTVLYFQSRSASKASPWDNQPNLAMFWGGFLNTHRQTDLVLPDDSASVMEDITRSPFTLDDYINRTFIGQIETSHMSSDRKEDVNQILSHDLVTFGSVRATQALLEEIPARYPHSVTLSRYFTSDQLKLDNVILVGGRKSVPWDYLFKLNFVTDFDYVHGMAIVRDVNPNAGEQKIYSNTAASAVIAYLPNPSHTGNVLILAGVDSDATGAAAAFLTSESKMESLRQTFHTQQFPYFEVLLKSSRLSGTVFDTELVAYRTYPNLH